MKEQVISKSYAKAIIELERPRESMSPMNLQSLLI